MNHFDNRVNAVGSVLMPWAMDELLELVSRYAGIAAYYVLNLLHVFISIKRLIEFMESFVAGHLVGNNHAGQMRGSFVDIEFLRKPASLKKGGEVVFEMLATVILKTAIIAQFLISYISSVVDKIKRPQLTVTVNLFVPFSTIVGNKRKLANRILPKSPLNVSQIHKIVGVPTVSSLQNAFQRLVSSSQEIPNFIFLCKFEYFGEKYIVLRHSQIWNTGLHVR